MYSSICIIRCPRVDIINKESLQRRQPRNVPQSSKIISSTGQAVCYNTQDYLYVHGKKRQPRLSATATKATQYYSPYISDK
jgi:hypothetical protein